MKRIVVLLFAVVLSGVVGLGQERYVKPVDEANQDASFFEFRKKLITAAERKDLKYVQSIMDPQIELSFGGHSGLSGFRSLWKNEADFWAEFLPVIKNGGRFVGEGRNKLNSFSAPYLFTDMPEDLDHFEHLAVFGNNVNLRERPQMDAPVISQLSYNIVKVDPEAAIKKKTGPGEYDWKIDWQKVTTLGGQTGWMKAEYVRSPIDYRAGFDKKRGRWLMTYFIAGD
ncbi:MAG TPA: SH3 domain-containing protein [Pyrinomonadaceae bacterium]